MSLEGSGPSLLRQRREHAQTMRRQQQQLGTAVPAVRLGLWDEHTVITPLQLTVCLSLAMGVDEQSVSVQAQGAFFFDVRIDGEGAWLMDAINTPDGAFLNTLNQQASAFGARMVVSHAAQGDASNATAASVGTDWSTANANTRLGSVQFSKL